MKGGGKLLFLKRERKSPNTRVVPLKGMVCRSEKKGEEQKGKEERESGPLPGRRARTRVQALRGKGKKSLRPEKRLRTEKGSSSEKRANRLNIRKEEPISSEEKKKKAEAVMMGPKPGRPGKEGFIPKKRERGESRL